jgi:hypothetical protein
MSKHGGRKRRRRRAALRKERDARYRARRDACRIVVPVEIGGEALDLLLSTRWLSEADSADAKKIGAAISAMLSASARV